MDFTGRIAWVTGASSGIGRALALALAGRGARLILSGRRESALDEVAAEISGGALVLPFDTTDLTGLAAVVERAANWAGRIDILVNNAGISQRSLAVDSDTAVYDAVIGTDLIAPIHLTQHCLPHLIKNGTGQIVAISSIAGRCGVPLRTAYCAAKHGLIGYMDALRAETTTAYGLQVLNVLPGSVATNVARNALTAHGAPQGFSDDNIDNGLSADACAAAIVDAMLAGKREIIVADGFEAQMAALRQSDGEALFDLTAQLGARFATGGLV